MIYGDLAAACSHCHALDIKLVSSICPECRTEFKYIAFRNVTHHFPKMEQLNEENPKAVMIDYEDYKRSLAKTKAEDFWK